MSVRHPNVVQGRVRIPILGRDYHPELGTRFAPELHRQWHDRAARDRADGQNTPVVQSGGDPDDLRRIGRRTRYRFRELQKVAGAGPVRLDVGRCVQIAVAVEPTRDELDLTA